MNINNNYDAMVLGAGPAGLTAGISLSWAKLKTLIVDEGLVGASDVILKRIHPFSRLNSKAN